HFEKVIAAGECLSSRLPASSSTGCIKLLFITSVRFNLRRQNAATVLHCSQYRCACAITKQYACLPVRVIDVLRQNFRAHNNCMSYLTRPDHGISKGNSVQKPGTRRD